MKTRYLKIVLLFSLLFNLSVAAGAASIYFIRNSSWTTPFGARYGKDRFLFDEMALSKEQAKNMREAAIPFRARLEQKRSDIITRKMQLLTLLRSDMPDRAALNSTLAQISRLQSDVEGMVVDHILLEKSKLDTVNQQRFIDLLQQNMKLEKAACLSTR